MDLAVAQGFDVRVVALTPGIDPADDPNGFEAKLASAAPYVVYRTRVEIDRAEDRTAAHQTVKTFLDALPDSPAKQDAWRYANDRLGMTVQLSAGAAPSPRLVQADDRRERDALAGVVAHPTLKPMLAELTPEHFHDATNRAVRNHLVDGTPLDSAGISRLAELDARAESGGINDETGKELLLRLRARELRSELQHSDPERTKELQEALTKIHEAVDSLALRREE
jgi:hypothetical protein